MAALAGMAIAYPITTLAAGNSFNVFVIVFEAVLLGLALLVGVGRWWSYAVGALVAALLFTVTLSGGMDRLRDPADPVFPGLIAFLAFGLIAGVAGIWSTIQARRGGPARA